MICPNCGKDVEPGEERWHCGMSPEEAQKFVDQLEEEARIKQVEPGQEVTYLYETSSDDNRGRLGGIVRIGEWEFDRAEHGSKIDQRHILRTLCGLPWYIHWKQVDFTPRLQPTHAS